MRISLRTSVQAILLFALLMFLNAYIALFHDQNIFSQEQNRELEEYHLHDRAHRDRAVHTAGHSINNVSNQNGHFLEIQDHVYPHSSLNDTSIPLKGAKATIINVIRKSTVNHLDVKLQLESVIKVSKTLTIPINNVNSNGINLLNGEIDYSLDTSESRSTELSDIFISVKTTKKFHEERLGLLLDTWANLARDETYYFTDGDDEVLQKRTRGHVINTNCSSLHNRVALCCKMSVEYDYYMASNKRWFCHVDDDTYINIPELSRLLRKYNHTEDWYLGKPSLKHPLEVNDPEHKGQKVAFWFATGGAGICISRSLALKMMPHTAGGRLKSACARIRLPDDCTIGYIIYVLLSKELTVVPQFHSHLEGLWILKPDKLDQQITLSHNWSSVERLKNIVHVDGFSELTDPTRFRSIHCRLFPYLKNCPQASRL